MRYSGADRRVHQVFVTRNTEYHVRSGLCVGVRDRRTGAPVAGVTLYCHRRAGTIINGHYAPETVTDISSRASRA